MTRSTPLRSVAAVTGTVALAVTTLGGRAAASAPPADGDVDRADWPASITLAAVPSEESTSLEESYDTVIGLLEEELGVDVEFHLATDYAGVIEGIIADDVDIAGFGPFSYVIAVANGAEIVPIASMVDTEETPPGYQSYGIARADNDAVNSIDDFAGRAVCFVDPSSTSGYLYPSAGLIDAGIDPDTDLSAVFAGGHDASAISVANGDCEAGFAYDSMVTEALVNSGDIAEGELKVVWESAVIPGSPVAVRSALPASLQDEIQRVFVEEANVDALVERGVCDDVETCEVRDERDRWGYVAVDDALYDGVRAVCASTRAEACATT